MLKVSINYNEMLKIITVNATNVGVIAREYAIRGLLRCSHSSRYTDFSRFHLQVRF